MVLVIDSYGLDIGIRLQDIAIDVRKVQGIAKCRLQLGGSLGRTYVCDLVVE